MKSHGRNYEKKWTRQKRQIKRTNAIEGQSTESYSTQIQEAIEKYAVSCRRIAAYDTPIDVNNEYRVAVRAPNNPGRLYHVIYQLSDGTWAGKDDQGASEHFDNGNPSISPEMWSDDAYPASAGTIYFAVERW